MRDGERASRGWGLVVQWLGRAKSYGIRKIEGRRRRRRARSFFAVLLAIRDADMSPLLFKKRRAAADETKYLQRCSTAVLL